MKRLVKKKQPTETMISKSQHHISEIDQNNKEGIDHLLLQRIGKSRQEILDLMKILKTF